MYISLTLQKISATCKQVAFCLQLLGTSECMSKMEVEIMSNAAMKLCKGKQLIVTRLIFTSKYSCCYHSLKLFYLHAHVTEFPYENNKIVRLANNTFQNKIYFEKIINNLYIIVWNRMGRLKHGIKIFFGRSTKKFPK